MKSNDSEKTKHKMKGINPLKSVLVNLEENLDLALPVNYKIYLQK